MKDVDQLVVMDPPDRATIRICNLKERIGLLVLGTGIVLDELPHPPIIRLSKASTLRCLNNHEMSCPDVEEPRPVLNLT